MTKIDEYMKLPQEELKKRIAANHEVLKKIWDEDDGNSYEKYQEKCFPYNEDNFALYTAMILTMDKDEIKVTPIDEHDLECLMTIKEFTACCRTGFITSWDGDGVYATADGITNIDADPEAFKLGYIRKDFTHVCWYNK